MKNYYAFRTDRNHRTFMYAELQAKKLRQGWGFEPGQDLSLQQVDKGSFRNRSMLNVAKGDLILIPGLPSSTEIVIAEATSDWSLPKDGGGYRFEIDEGLKDYGHIFPVEIKKVFERHHESIPASIRRTFRTPMRFWSLNDYGKDIERIVNNENALTERSVTSDKVTNIIAAAYEVAFDRSVFRKALVDDWNEKFGAAEWEDALVAGLTAVYPHYIISRTGGVTEKQHGTDILIRIPVPFGSYDLGIAVQVKDYKGGIGQAPVNQIMKASYWNDKEAVRIVQHVIIATQSTRSENKQLVADNLGVDFVFAEDLAELLVTFGEVIVSDGINKVN